MSSTACLVRACVVIVPVIAAAAQSPPRVSLRPPDATLPVEFTGITSVRELTDGRVIVTDGREQRLLVADFRAGTAEEIGRKGKGPGEYTMVGFVHSIGRDSSIISDLLSRRWILLDGARIVATVPPDARAIVVTHASIQGADQLGRVMLTMLPPATKSGVTVVTKHDSAEVTLVSRATGRADTVARLRRRPTELARTVDANGVVTSSYSLRNSDVLATGEDAVLFTDGWLAIARLEPFRVDWRSAAGRWIRGAPLPIPLVRMDGRERQAYMQRIAGGGRVRDQSEMTGWPDFIPPFFVQGRTLFPAADGRLLIRRTKSAGFEGVRYLVINRSGGLDGQLDMPANSNIIGFGARSAYVIATDADDIQRLQRHPWP